MLALALSALVTMVLRGPHAEALIGSVILGGVGGLMLWNARNRLQATSGLAPEDPVRAVAPYAFEIRDRHVSFPPTMYQPAEVWPLPGTVVTVRGTGVAEALVLEQDGRTTRRYVAKVLAETPSDAARRFEEIRRSVLGS